MELSDEPSFAPHAELLFGRLHRFALNVAGPGTSATCVYPARAELSSLRSLAFSDAMKEAQARSARQGAP